MTLPGKSVVYKLTALLVIAVAMEAVLWVQYYADIAAARDDLEVLEAELDLSSLKNTPDEVERIRARLIEASSRLASARKHTDRDPLLLALSPLPVLGAQARGLKSITRSAEAAVETGIKASDVLLAYAGQPEDTGETSIQEGVRFLAGQDGPMRDVRGSLDRLKSMSSQVPGGLFGPLDSASRRLKDASNKLEGLVTGYERANALLPEVLGFNGPRRYVILPQNDTELFPSGGLISNYGTATFSNGQIVDMQFEYFVNLFDRWQRDSGGEYVAPPGPLKNYLLRDVSWGLGEAGWYPDFPTTVEIAQRFLGAGGIAPSDGVIAMDLQFVQALLELFGPILVEEYGVTVDADTLAEVTLEQTRGETAFPGAAGKSFLSYLAKDLLNRILSSSREEWVDLVLLLDRMARERHLQLNFEDQRLQSLTAEYGFDGSIARPDADFLMLADASVNSTKLNMLIEPEIDIAVRLGEDGSAHSRVTYTVHNPFDQWRQGREPRLVRALMLDGVYGSYLRLYASEAARLLDLRVDSRPAGPEQNAAELGKRVFGRFFPVLPGETRSVEFVYTTPDIVRDRPGGLSEYSLHIQKEAGTRAIPVDVTLELPAGAEVVSLALDGTPLTSLSFTADLRQDRRISLVLRLPR